MRPAKHRRPHSPGKHPKQEANEPKSLTIRWGVALLVTAVITAAITQVVQWIPTVISRPDDAKALVVKEEWPMGDNSCAGTVAMSSRGPDPQQLPWSDQTLGATVASAGGGPYDSGTAALFLSSTSGRTLQILNIQPRIVSHTDAAPSWKIRPSAGGCGGGGQQRFFEWDMSSPGRPMIRDEGVAGGPPSNKARPFGATFTVSEQDPADLYVSVHNPPSGLTEFQLDIQYRVAGKEYVHTIGTGDHPLRILGGRTIQSYTIAWGGRAWDPASIKKDG